MSLPNTPSTLGIISGHFAPKCKQGSRLWTHLAEGTQGFSTCGLHPPYYPLQQLTTPLLLPAPVEIAEIIMLPKPVKPTHEFASYLPISLLPIPSKVFEKLLLKRLQTDVDLSHLIPRYKFGLRHGHSQVQQAYRIVNKIMKSLENRTLCKAAFLDVPQAFDNCVAHWLTV